MPDNDGEPTPAPVEPAGYSDAVSALLDDHDVVQPFDLAMALDLTYSKARAGRAGVAFKPGALVHSLFV